MKRCLQTLVFILLFNSLSAQTNTASSFEARPTSIREVIRQLSADTIVFYYNDRWQLVKPVCATISRVSRMDTLLLTFTGKFVDYYLPDSTIATEGNYNKGKKEGLFKSYFQNGQPAQAGNYVNDKKSGIWEYYYEDGSKRQILDFRENEMLIREFWNEAGKQLVTSGNGEWFSYTPSDKFMKTSGEVLNGRKNGTWKNTLPSQNMTTNIETYREGKLVSGKMFSVAGGTESYSNKEYCIVEQTPLFLAAEQFQMNRCYTTQKSSREFARYPGGMNRFYGQVRKKLVLNGITVNRGLVMVNLTIDADGRMTDFKPVSNTGHELDFIEVLQTMDNWFPAKINGKPTTQSKMVSIDIK